jgi:chitodextrinase
MIPHSGDQARNHPPPIFDESPMWNAASTCIVRVALSVVAAGLIGTAIAPIAAAAVKAPSRLTVTAATGTGATGTGITLSWSRSKGSKLSEYRLYRDGAYVGATTGTTYTFGALSCGKSYTLGVQAVDRAGNRSRVVTIVAATTACADNSPPTPPSNLSQTAATQTSISMSWSASADDVGVTAYNAYRDGVHIGTTSQRSYTFAGLGCGRSYTLAVAALDGAGNRSSASSVQASTSPCPDTAPPTVPGYLVQTSSTENFVALSWMPSLDDRGVAGYGIYVNGTRTSSTTLTSYTVGGLQCGTTYALGVDAYDAAGNRSAAASVLAATKVCPPAPDTQPPTTPSGLTKSGATETSLTVSWTAATDNVSLAGYGIYLNGTKVASTTSTSRSLTGLTCGTNYTVAVDAYDTSGNRSPKSSLAAATNQCPAAPPPPPPSNLGSALPAGLAAPSGAAFYVSMSGSDSNPGTLSSPWRTVQKAVNTLGAGQVAYVRAGTYSENLLITRSGSATAPITVQNYPGERPVLRPAGGSTNNYPVEIYSAAYLRLRGFVIEGASGPSTTNVYFEGRTHHVEVSQCEIRGSADQGVYSEATTSHLWLLGNSIHDNGNGNAPHQSHGLYIEGTDHLIANNEVYNQRYGYGLHLYPSGDRITAVQNTLVGNREAGIVIGAESSSTVNNTRLVNNIVAYNGQFGIRSYFPASSLKGSGNVAFNNLGFGNPQGDFSTWQGGGIDYSLGNIVADPRFVDRAAGNFRLQSGSAALDKATSPYSMSLDLSGRARPLGAAADIGAYEG